MAEINIKSTIENPPETLILEITENHGRTWTKVKIPQDATFLSVIDMVKKPGITNARFRTNVKYPFARAITILPE